MSDRILERVRLTCLAHPQAEERQTWDEPTFRIRDKIFCAYVRHSERPALTCKAPEGSQAVLVGADPERFFIPRFVGHIGWIGMWLDGKVDWDEVAKLVARSYLMTAPKRLGMRKAKVKNATARKQRPVKAKR
jgi:predicted DNA-binding protein (MmcQ/YjbR family)